MPQSFTQILQSYLQGIEMEKITGFLLAEEAASNRTYKELKYSLAARRCSRCLTSNRTYKELKWGNDEH